MICYLDKTFCSANCLTVSCDKNWTDAKRQSAREWWGDETAPVAFADFSERCPEYRPRVTQ